MNKLMEIIMRHAILKQRTYLKISVSYTEWTRTPIYTHTHLHTHMWLKIGALTFLEEL